ncbi:MAG: hypothetical protein N2661_12285, partial [Anoxybacillus mongoliensis]|nr:hypothetical protein [Anoxybacillus mongoliensis]
MKKHTSRIIGVFIVTIMVITSLSILMSMMLLQRYENKVKSIPVSNLARIKVNPVINTVKQNYY